MQTLLAILAGGAAATIFAAAPFPLLAQWRPSVARELGSAIVVPTFCFASFLGCVITGAIAGRRSLSFGSIVALWVALLCLGVLRDSMAFPWQTTIMWLAGIIGSGVLGLLLGSRAYPQPESISQEPLVTLTEQAPLPECPPCSGDQASCETPTLSS